MSDVERSAEARALDALVAEAKEHRDGALAEIDWSRVEARVMTAVEEERPALLRDLDPRRPSRRDGALRAGALLLAAAAAAAVVLVVRKDHEAGLADPAAKAESSVAASSLRATEGAGAVRIGGMVATAGRVVQAGEIIESDGARAVFERPRKVTWLLESDGRTGVAQVRVKSAGEALVLGLEQGVIEAQVVPVAAGEAFAIDIATPQGVVRVAVHGTHLRVARAGHRVVVDLTEGVVSIGVPPRTGATYGTLVTAPAHVELDATDLRTLRVNHAPSSVRAPIPLGPQEPVAAVHGETSAAPADPAPAPPRPPLVGKGPAPHPAESPPPPRVEAPASAHSARDAIASAVRRCAAAHARSGDVNVTLTSTLQLRVSPHGTVESAQFTPPLLPDIQTCAARAIYKAKLDETGIVTIPIAFSY